MAHLLDMNAIEPMSLDLVDDLSIYTDTAEGPPPPGVNPNFICFETSRGCYWRCSFCTAPSRGRYRFMSPGTVEKHLKYFRSVGIKTIVFQEATHSRGSSKRRLAATCTTRGGGK